MQAVSLPLTPHVDTQGTPTQVGQAMTTSGLIRIKNGYVQKLGGCTFLTTTLHGAFANIILPWSTTSNVFLIAVGTVVGLEVNTGGGTPHDITPAAYAGDGGWTLGIWGADSWLVSAYQGGGIYYWSPSLPLTGSGISLPVTGLVTGTIATSGNSYDNVTGNVLLTTTTATSVAIGETFTLSGLTGTGAFASLNGTWVATSGTVGTTITFTASSGLGATTITGGSILALGVPSKVNGIFVAAPQQQLFAWGAYSATLGAQDPLLIAWCDVANLQDWTAEVTNQAGSFRLSSGSLIVSATWFGLVGLFWTDLDIWGAQYLGFPLVYGFQRLGQNCGLISPQAWAILGTTVVWMGQNDFFIYEGGAVRVLPCSVRDFIFNTLNRGGSSEQYPIHADSNSYFNEVTWRFSQPTANGLCNAYVKWSPNENNAWDVWADPPTGPFTVMWLNSWTDQSFVHPPLGVSYDGNIYKFEIGSNAAIIDYNGAALDSFYETGWFYIAEGQEQVFFERIMPDFVFTPIPGGTPAGAVQITLYFADEIPTTATDYPVRTYGPYTITPTTPYVIVRGRGRVMRYRVDCTTTGTFWRSGKHMARISIDGRAF